MPRLDTGQNVHGFKKYMRYDEHCKYKFNGNAPFSRSKTLTCSNRPGLRTFDDDNQPIIRSAQTSIRSHGNGVLNTPYSDRILRSRLEPIMREKCSSHQIIEQHNSNSLGENNDSSYFSNIRTSVGRTTTPLHRGNRFSTNSAYRQSWFVPRTSGMSLGLVETRSTTFDSNNNSSLISNLRRSNSKSFLHLITKMVTNRALHLISIIFVIFAAVGHVFGAFFKSIIVWFKKVGVNTANPNMVSSSYRRQSASSSSTTPMTNRSTISVICGSKICLMISLLPLICILFLTAFIFRPLGKEPASLGIYLPSDAACFSNDPLRPISESVGQRAALRLHCLMERVYTFISPSFINHSTPLNFFSSEPTTHPSKIVVNTLESLQNQLSTTYATVEKRINALSTRIQEAHQQVDNITSSVSILTKEQQRLLAKIQPPIHFPISSQIQTSLADLQTKLNALEQTVTTGSIQQQMNIVDRLVKQAVFISATSLETRMDKMRQEFEEKALRSMDNQNAAKFEQFARALNDIRTLIDIQRSDLDSKLEQAKFDFDSHRKSMTNLLTETNAGSSDKQSLLIEVAQVHANEGLVNLDRQIVTLNSRLVSLEQFNTNLDENFKEITLKSEQDVNKRNKVLEASQALRITESLETLKDSFKNQLSSSLRQKIIDELESKSRKSDLKLSVLALIKSAVDENLRHAFKDLPNSMGGELIGQVRGYLDASLTIFKADRTGKADFALGSAGGSVVSIRCTRTYKNGLQKLNIFGFDLTDIATRPQAILEPAMYPGECWCFHGNEGQAIIKLAASTYLTGVTLEHVPKSLTLTGKIDSAPRDFAIKALNSKVDDNGTVLGSFTFDQYGESLQYFPISIITDKPVSYVELVISKNHGHQEFTCVYRLRVHGTSINGP